MVFELNSTTPTAQQFDFNNPPTDPIQLAKDMAESVISLGVLGLSACQVGQPYRMFVIKANPVIACFNPIIVDQSEESVYLDEGCASLRNIILKVKRPSVIRVRYKEPNGNVVTTKFQGITARIFQHELDHLNGITMLQRASHIHKEKALATKKKFDRR